MRNTRKNKPVPHQSSGESGAALVMVLGMVGICMLFVVQAMAVAEKLSFDLTRRRTAESLRYLAESAEATGYWMHLTDRRLHTNRTLGQSPENRLGNQLEETWMADRREHRLSDDPPVRFFIGTPLRSIRLDDPQTLMANLPIDAVEERENLTRFLDLLQDYTDSDSTLRLNGKEDDDYAQEGLLAMPRNGAFQWKEEFYWLDDWQQNLYGELSILPPKGKTLPNEKPSLFSATPEEIQAVLQDNSPEEQQAVQNALALWQTQGIPLNENLDATLLLAVQNHFSTKESSVSQYTTEASSKDGSVRLLLTTVRECDFSQATIYADRSSQTLSLWQKTIQ